MWFFWIHVTVITFYLVLLTVQISGELIMIRHPPEVKNGLSVQKFTCVSEDDGSALVWNAKSADLNQSMSKFGKVVGAKPGTQFPKEWQKMSSKSHSLGPIFSYPWEEFAGTSKSQNYLSNLSKSGEIIFSVRGSADIHLRFGRNNMTSTDSCYNITLAGSNTTNSSICSCHDEGSRSKTSDCSFRKGSLVDVFQWRTFIINWHSTDKIQVLTGTHEEILKKNVSEWVNIARLIVTDNPGQHFRFHIYNYLQTNKNDTILSLPTNGSRKCGKNENLFVHVLVALCTQCQLNVHVVNKDNTSFLVKTIHGKQLLFWQIVELNISCNKNDFMNQIRLKMSIRTNQTKNKPWVAIHNFRLLYQPRVTRRSTKSLTLSANMSDLACQKLYYSENSVVHSNAISSKINSSSLNECLMSRKGLFCDFGCNGSCNGTSICNPNGCTCAPGFRGSRCTEKCSLNEYGYNCEQRCSCGNYSCNSTTGKCDNSTCLEYYLKPDCQKKLEAPIVGWINEFELYLNYTLALDENQRKNFHFEIKREDEKWINRPSDWVPFNSDLPKKYIGLLVPYKMYQVRAVINETKGLEASFNTTWQLTRPQNLIVVSSNNGTVILKWKHHPRSWEKTEGFNVRIDYLGSTTLTHPLKEYLTTKKCLAKEKYKICNLTLLFSNAVNYSISVEAVDKDYGNSTAFSLWYLVPIDVSRDELPVNFTLKFAFPRNGNVSENSVVYVIFQGYSICPELSSLKNWTKFDGMKDTKNESMKTHFPKEDTKLHSLETGEYPVCQLRLNETYKWNVILNDNKSHLEWLAVLLIFGFCGLLFYVVYQKYGIIHLGSQSSMINHNTKAYEEPTSKQEELVLHNSVPYDIQRLMSFENYVKRAAEDGVLQQQFMWLPKGLLRSCECGRLPENKPKNRYGNLIPYDETRVILAKDSSGDNSDYINANYIDGYCKEKAYIATQGPLPNTVKDFWWMIWQEEVRIICMLVDLVESKMNMCERYWPEVGEEIEYGDIIVLTMNQRVYADYTYRSFLVSTRQETDSQIIEHLQYTGWPNEGVPMYSHSIVEYLHKMLSVPPGQGPIVVHCSSGIGRTGTIILCDICLRHLAAEGTVDVFNEAKKMYNARGNMLGNLSQYVLAHLVPAQCLLSLPTKVLCADITQEKIDEMKNDLPAHIKRLEDCFWMDKAIRPLEPIRPPLPENILKNRFPKLTPAGPNLVSLTRYPPLDLNSDYISAVSVDGARIRKQFIASQLPMPSTINNFWRLIVEQNIELIIVIQQPNLEDDTCCSIVPRETTLNPVPYLKVETKKTSNYSEHFTTDQLQLTDASQKPARVRNITVLTFNHWNYDEDARPPAPEVLVELWRASERIQRPHGRTVTLCYDGVTACGLYLALSFILDRMGVEQECDVILAVRAVRRSRPEFLRSQWQLEYLYDAAVKYVETFHEYGNFTRSVESHSWFIDP